MFSTYVVFCSVLDPSCSSTREMILNLVSCESLKWIVLFASLRGTYNDTDLSKIILLCARKCKKIQENLLLFVLKTSFVFLIDLLTVSETAHDVNFDEGNGINSPTNLGLEATFINQNFSQQCLKRDIKKKVFPNSNPFVTDEDEGQVASVAYRYGDKSIEGRGLLNISKLQCHASVTHWLIFTVNMKKAFEKDIV